ncbi:AfsR/SARP family transcriptional regulator [Streptomyces spinoverrucosus]|uniref:AfsR/SARP family transcriptional regulator n=1 Tax=Streptomyces spinoverrucosus TaxID=284043 RepID=UPI0018C3C04C|nr:AfsR/SARP family transcriptional regulator [Streptomyces spinoverrucosus]MBG0853549.1 AfsR/SARP family transcriptional regulator [Streptomyces spinoverrucosus]
MEIGTLGPFRFQINGNEAGPRAPKIRQMLALFSVRSNQVVLMQHLVQELWSEYPPRSAKITLQTYIVRLRQQLAKNLEESGTALDPKDLLQTFHGGYQLTVDPAVLEYRRFEELAARGRREIATGDYARAALLLRSALDMWRGSALVDISTGPLLHAHVTRLNNARVTAVEQLMEAELRQGRHLDILGDLTDLTAEHPFHENLHAQLMVALYRAGRRSQALEVFAGLRSALVTHLGIDPSYRLNRLHRAILNGDQTLEDLPQSGGILLDRFAA